jgi:hypothetical protein
MKKFAFLFLAIVLLSGASRPPSHSGPVMTTPARDSPIVNGGTHPTGTKPIGKANNGTNKPQGGKCRWDRCISLCNKLYPPGTGIREGQDARHRCTARCDLKYVGQPC